MALAALGAAVLLWHPSSEAGGAPFDPLVTAIAKDKQLQIAVALPKETAQRVSGTLAVELLGANGQRLADTRTDLRDSDPLSGKRLVLATVPAANEAARLRVTFGGRQAEVPLAKAMLVKAHEMTLSGGQDMHVGAPATLSCNVHGVRSAIDTVPLPGSEVVVRLRDNTGTGKPRDLFSGRTGASGRADIQFDVPDIAPGNYTLEVATRSALGAEKLERPVQIRADSKVMLVSDRPIYQPGHVIHLRALALRPFDMRPVADRDIVFEVEDPKGNKVFKRTFKTSPFGVAFVDFQLADEVNMGDYHLRAVLGDTRAEKTVQVKRYVLPKFKTEVTADKRFYLPKETVKLELQSDYFFGKPVAGAKVEIQASTFDVAFNKFHTWKGETDANGHTTLEIKLPDYFVGQPLQKGDALVKLDVKIVDTAEHAETLTKTYPVSDQPVRISLIAEGGKIVPGMENRIFAAATYPDGTPAPNTEIQLLHPTLPPQQVMPMGPGRRGGLQPVALEEKAGQPGKQAGAKPKLIATIKTNAAGLAEFKVTPKADELRTGNWGQQEIEMLGGKQQRWGPQIVYDVIAAAKDPRGNSARIEMAINSQPAGENVLLRLDKAIYQSGDRLGIDIRTSAGLPTVYVDIVRGGQIMLSKWLEVKDGKALQTLDLPQTVFGSLEVHAYQMLQTGEIIRDSRVVYVQPRNDLKVTVTPGKAEFEPGEDGMIRFHVTDAKGTPTAAAIGVIIVDEAVYALQDLQPGLEKVYFTLQEELLKPQAQIKLSPGETIDNLVVQPVLPAPRQQVAEVLLTAVKLPAPRRFVIDPAQERKQRIENQVRQIGSVVFWYSAQGGKNPLQLNRAAGRWEIRPNLLEEIIAAKQMGPQMLETGLGAPLTISDLGRLEKDFTADKLGQAITAHHMSGLLSILEQYLNQNRNRYFAQGEWILPANLIDEALRATKREAFWGQDVWGRPLRLVRLEKKADHPYVPAQFAQYELISAGPDGKLSNADDVRMRDVIKGSREGWLQMAWFMPPTKRGIHAVNGQVFRFDRLAEGRELALQRAGAMPPGAAFGGVGGGGPLPAPTAMPRAEKSEAKAVADRPTKSEPAQGQGGGSAEPRVRELFPETMLWQPALITDDKGEANLALSFADSITTWRLSASANSRGGALGGATVPLKVFQDFFVDIDLPIHLTQGDEIAFPVAVYNYLKTPQTVKIELQKESWFELLDGGGLVRNLDLKPSEVTSVKFRIRAGKLGMQPLTVKAYGSKKSDAVKRLIDVAPNGQRFEKVATDRLKGKATQVIDIPADSVPDASKLIVRIYPGVMAQVLEGVEGLIRLPGG
jgi:hypothetical protein